MDHISRNELWHTEMDRLCIDQASPGWPAPVGGRTRVSIGQIVALVVSVVSMSLGALGGFIVVSGGAAGAGETAPVSSVANLVELMVGILGLGLVRYHVRGFLITAGGVYLALGLIEVFAGDPGSPRTIVIGSSMGLSELRLDPMIGPLLRMWLGTAMLIVGYLAHTRARIKARYGLDRG